MLKLKSYEAVERERERERELYSKEISIYKGVNALIRDG